MKKKKMRWLLTDQRLIHAEVDSETVVGEYGHDMLRAVAVDIRYEQRYSGVGANRVVTDDLSREFGKIEFFSNGVSLGRTSRIEKPTEEVNKIYAILSCNVPTHRIQRMPDNTIPTLPRASRSANPPGGQPPETTEDPIKILTLRFAKGEITKEQFEEMKRMLT